MYFLEARTHNSEFRNFLPNVFVKETYPL